MKVERPVFIVFTDNWIDPNGVGHGFRYVSTSSYADCAHNSANNYNTQRVSGASAWSVAMLTPEMIRQNIVTQEKTPTT